MWNIFFENNDKRSRDRHPEEWMESERCGNITFKKSKPCSRCTASKAGYAGQIFYRTSDPGDMKNKIYCEDKT